MSIQQIISVISYLNLNICVEEESYHIAWYDIGDKEIVISTGTKPVYLLHEAGHALNHLYSDEAARDEALAWNTAKALAIDIGYVWTDEDQRILIQSLTGYGIPIPNDLV